MGWAAFSELPMFRQDALPMLLGQKGKAVGPVGDKLSDESFLNQVGWKLWKFAHLQASTVSWWLIQKVGNGRSTNRSTICR